MKTVFSDPSAGLHAFVVADTLVDGRGMGGTRIWHNVTPDEVAQLAKKMSLKLALAELPIGGAKAGIVSDLPPGPERDRRLRAFGRIVGPMLRGGIYLGSDMGCSYRDRDLFFEAGHYSVLQTERRGPRAGHTIPCSWPELWTRCEDVTGFGVAHATLAVGDRLELPATRRTVVIQGFGIVGRGAARLMSSQGYRIVGVADVHGTIWKEGGLPLDEVLGATSPAGVIDRTLLSADIQRSDKPDAWLDIDAGVLLLAAGGDAITLENQSRVRAKIIGEGANLPVSADAQRALYARGVVDIPDILANIGGAIVTALVLCGATPTHLPVDPFVEWIFQEVSVRVRNNTALVFERSHQEGTMMHDTASALAQERAAPRYTKPTLSVIPPR